jgi:cobalt-zinc-cadmium efflux system outer membrane protein
MRFFVSGVLVASLLMTGCLAYHAKPLQAPELETAYRTRTVDGAQLRSFVESGLGTAPSTWPPPALDLKTLTLIGYYYSADLDVARARLAVAEAGIRAAGARVNPSLGLQAGYNRNPESHVEYAASPSFTIETAGKRGYRILRAEREADAAVTGLVEAGWHLRSRIRAAFFNRLLATERLDLFRREQSIRAEIVQIFDRRLAVGEAARPELDVYRVDLITTEASVRAAIGESEQTQSTLANAVGLPLSALDRVHLTSTTFDAPVPGEGFQIAAVKRAGLLHRADLRRSLDDYAAADATLRLELASQYPDLVLTPGYTFEEGFVRYVLNAALEPLAVFHRNQGPIAVADAQRREAGERFEALQAQAIGEMERAIVQYRGAFEEWREANDRLIGVQRDREDAARRALEAGEGDRLSLATVRLQTVTAARARLDALTRVQTALGALEDAMQQPLEDALSIPDPTRVSPRKGAVSGEAPSSFDNAVGEYIFRCRIQRDGVQPRWPTQGRQARREQTLKDLGGRSDCPDHA